MYVNKGIRCNGIASGGVITNIGMIMTDSFQWGMERQAIGQVTMPRASEAEEIAQLALFLDLMNQALLMVKSLPQMPAGRHTKTT